jgi:hypothetical protein
MMAKVRRCRVAAASSLDIVVSGIMIDPAVYHIVFKRGG